MLGRKSMPAALPIYLSPNLFHHPQETLARQTGLEVLKPLLTHDCASPQTDFVNGYGSHLRCANCAIDLCHTSQIISKGFTGRHGRAYLVSPSMTPLAMTPQPDQSMTTCLANTYNETPSRRQLVTGAHIVSDVLCAFCNTVLGWKYHAAEEESQSYKIGNYILETKMVCSSSKWDESNDNRRCRTLQLEGRNDWSNNGVDFDSQNEEECEDLFAGVWSPALALKRRRNISPSHQTFDLPTRQPEGHDEHTTS